MGMHGVGANSSGKSVRSMSYCNMESGQIEMAPINMGQRGQSLDLSCMDAEGGLLSHYQCYHCRLVASVACAQSRDNSKNHDDDDDATSSCASIHPNSNFLQVPEEFANRLMAWQAEYKQNSATPHASLQYNDQFHYRQHRSKSIDGALEFLCNGDDELIDVFCSNNVDIVSNVFMHNLPNKPRAVSIDLNMIGAKNHGTSRAPSTNRYVQYQSHNRHSKWRNRKKSNLGVDRSRSTASNKGLSADNIHRLDKAVSQWTNEAQNADHIWVDSNYSGDLCYVGDQACEKSGPKTKCVACKILVHEACKCKLTFKCRPTFREAGVRDYRDDMQKQNNLLHHWVHRKRQEGKCRQCNKSFQNKYIFNPKELVAVQCSWCKVAYHNKLTCFPDSKLTETCNRGQHCDSIIPPAWILKMPTKNTFKSSVRKSRSPEPTNRTSLFVSPEGEYHGDVSTAISASSCQAQPLNPSIEINGDLSVKMTKSISLQSNINLNCNPFVVKPIPNTYPNKPLLVYVNPKSGGNDGMKLLGRFQWLLNPRQVFDITDKGPKRGLELFGRIANLRILVCGGDGTAGWVMSEMDNLGITNTPPLAILPLGTGNDLARTTNWGGGYKDESLSKILTLVEEGTVKPIDRWDLTSSVHSTNVQASTPGSEHNDVSSLADAASSPVASKKLPLSVFNNYFSLGFDAAVTLDFHESREANPEKFNSRIKNKIFYAGAGGREFIKGSWKDLSEHLELICDNIDYTPRIREIKPLALLFLNIPRYSAGTTPWGHPTSGFQPQSFSDGKLEVMGFNSTHVATVQVGGHAERICQCNYALITTTKSIPMQVDGEPCKLLPSKIKISLRNQFQIIMRPKRPSSLGNLSDDESSVAFTEINQLSNISVFVIPNEDYEDNVLDRNKVLEAARFYGMLKQKSGTRLTDVRRDILTIQSDIFRIDEEFFFLDATTSSRLFRVDKTKEEHHYLMDICGEDLYIVDKNMESNLKLHALESISNLNQIQLKMDDLPSQSSPLNPSPVLAELKEVSNSEEKQENVSGDEKDQPSNDMEIHVEIHAPTDKDDDNSPLASPVHSESDVDIVASVNQTAEVDAEGDKYDLDHHTQDQGVDDQKQQPYDGIHAHSNIRKYKNAMQIDQLFLESCKTNSRERVESLILDGADILATDEFGNTSLHIATQHRSLAVVHYLLNNGPDELLEMREHVNGRTALHVAVEMGRHSLVSLLVSAGSSLQTRDKHGLTPAQLSKDEHLQHFLQKEELFEKIEQESRKMKV